MYAPFAEAEATRRRLAADGVLRKDLEVLKQDGGVVFPATHGETTYDFPARPVRPQHYTDLLDWAPELKAAAPRAFDSLGDVIIVKIPKGMEAHAGDIGEALRRFHDARAVFHDAGVTGELRTRDLQRIAGDGGSETEVMEHGATLRIDPAAAYYSPRLAQERARIAAAVHPGERVIDLFGGVAPQGIQLAKAGASVVSVDLNPSAIDLARHNASANRVELELHEGDARIVAQQLAAADRVIMNLPHGAKDFLDVGAALVRPGGVLHHHEILETAQLGARREELIATFRNLGRAATIEATRHVRAYSSREAHYVFDVRLP